MVKKLKKSETANENIVKCETCTKNLVGICSNGNRTHDFPDSCPLDWMHPISKYIHYTSININNHILNATSFDGALNIETETETLISPKLEMKTYHSKQAWESARGVGSGVYDIQAINLPYINLKGKKLYGLKVGGSNLEYMTGGYNPFSSYDVMIRKIAKGFLSGLNEYSHLKSHLTPIHERKEQIPQKDIISERFIYDVRKNAEIKQAHLDRGNQCEASAINKFCEITGHKVITLSPFSTFCNQDFYHGMVFGTPDAITACGKIVETKVPNTKSKYVSASYECQLKAYMRLLGLNGGYLAKYYVHDPHNMDIKYFKSDDCAKEYFDLKEEDFMRSQKEILFEMKLILKCRINDYDDDDNDTDTDNNNNNNNNNQK